MYPAKLSKLEARLDSQLPLLGECLRQRAAQALARDGSPDAVRSLAKAVTCSDDRQVLAIALDALRQIRKQQCIDEVCAVWAVTRHKDLANLLIKKGWVASAPVEVKVLSALKAEQLEVVTKGGAEIVEPLLKAFSDADSEIASRASQCAIALTNSDAIDYLCERWSKTRDRFLEQLMLQGKYVARKPIEVRVLSALNVERLEVIALRIHIRTVIEGSINTFTKAIKFIPALPHPILEHKPPALNLVEVRRIRRQIPQFTSCCCHNFLNGLSVMKTGIIDHKDIAWMQLW